jgi:hypothetical protein
MTDQDYERRSEPWEVEDSTNLDSYSLSLEGNETDFNVNPPIVVPAGKYTVMIRKSLIATGGRPVDAVTCRVENEVIYVDPVYNATGEPGY